MYMSLYAMYTKTASYEKGCSPLKDGSQEMAAIMLMPITFNDDNVINKSEWH